MSLFPGLKKVLGQHVYYALRKRQEELAPGMRVELTPVTDMVTQLKIWESSDRPPRYFTIRLSENM